MQLLTFWPDYLASCNGDCTTVDKTALEFFKIDGVGLLDDTTIPGNWATDTLIANNNSWTVTIPTDIAPGNYVLRHEIIALHSAGTTDGAQNYPQCFNLEVTGSGTAVPTGTLGEALYTPSDAGILINIYAAISSYVVPGPTLYSGAISASQTLDAAATSIAAVGTAASSAAAVVTSSAASVVASSSAASPATLVAASPSSGVTAAPINASGAPFSNGTASASKKSKSACKVKTSKSAPALSSITQVAQVSSSASLSTMSFADSVTIPTTSIAIPTTTSTSISSVATPVSGSTDTTASTASVTTSSDATVPSGTTLGNLLSWISSFYAKNSGTDYNENTVARRSFLARREHSRQLVARQEMEKFDGVKAAATGTHPGFPQGTGHAHHGHGHAHGTGVQGGAKPTGAFASGKAFPTGSGKFRIGA